MIKQYTIKNLHCASCAVKIEDALIKLEGISLASIDLALGRLRLEAALEPDMTKLNTLVAQIEYGTELSEYQEKSADEPEENQNKELYKIIFSALLFVIGLIFEQDNLIFMTVFFIVPYILCGHNVLLQGARSILRRDFFNEFTLMSGATIAAIIIGEMPEAVGVMLFYCLGEFLQEKASIKSRRSIRSLLATKPSVAHLLINMQTVDKKPEEINIGDTIIVKPGEKIPLDALVYSGSSSLDLSSLTGESLPISVNKDDKVFAGTINLSSSLTLKVTSLYKDSAVARILEMVENATANKAPTERFITSFARYYTPVVVLIAALVAIIPPLLGLGTWSDFIYRALVLLVISCPCALIISIPLGYFAGIGAASKQGILVKGGQVFDALKNINTIAFDKTGTLTEGIFTITSLNPAPKVSQEDLLHYACIAELNSNHPIAKSIIAANPNFDQAIQSDIKEVKEVAGQGLIANYNSQLIYAGNAALLKAHDFRDFESTSELGTIVYIAKNDQYLGSIIVGDKIKADSQEAINALHAYPISKLVMLTGDRSDVAKKVAENLKLDGYYPELLPQDKLTTLQSIAPATNIMFVGDGINDAPVLAAAGVSVAMGKLGSELAVELADAVILNDSPKKILNLLNIAKRTRTIVWQNIFIALSIKSVIMIFGVAGLSGLWEAVFADVGVALIAVINSTRQ